MTRTPFVNFDHDAKSCYDRILMPLASLAGRGFGIHRQVIFVHAQTLENAIFKLKLSNKVTAEAYRHCKQFPIHGTGQGSGNSPVIWCFVSSKLFECYESKAHGMTFTSPDGTVQFSMAIVGFVDDTTCITSGDPSQPLQAMLQRMQDDAQLWNNLLWSSGGCLELPKCGYHTIYYRFHDSGIPYLDRQHTDTVTIESPDGDEIPI